MWPSKSYNKIEERAKHIPLRLSDKERDLLLILEGAIEISEYTDKVDVSHTMYRFFWHRDELSKKKHLMKEELQKMLYFILGLHVSYDPTAGQKLVTDSDLQEHETYFKTIMEIGRRYKIVCPDKMRGTYGKLMHMMQDAVMPGLIDINVMSPIKCVYQLLEQHDAIQILSESELDDATACINSSSEEARILVEKKLNARAKIKQKYSDKLPESVFQNVIESITDSNSYIELNRIPVDKMIGLLKHYFDPDNEEDEYSLQIMNGRGGSCLSHRHSTQFTFVHQSLELWREIQDKMFYLWKMADADLLDERGYALTDTGQGLNRVQDAPLVSQAMSQILSTVKSRVGSWVGLSVVHLGDRDVPNALVFIDKYTQVPRILAPIVQTIERIEELAANPKTKPFLDEFGTVEHVRKWILCDFFKHGFDGSGDDGGSCVDGRLTSAWNWCSKIQKKDYYPIFLMTGFYGFDGSFKK